MARETFATRAGIWGYVKDAASGTGIPGAVVQIVDTNLRTTTRHDGFYGFVDLADGSYAIHAAAPAMGSRYGAVTAAGVSVARDAPGRPVFDARGNVDLPPTRCTGIVRRSDTSAPIAFAEIVLRASGVRATCNRQGEYALSAVEAGTQRVQASAAGFTAATQVVTLEAGQETVVEFTLTPA